MEKRAVLFIDDDEIVLKSIEKRITDESYNKHFVKSGEEALEILRQEKVHVIVVDVVVPGMNGIELLKTVKKEYPNIVSLVISGHTQSADVMMVMSDLGVYKYIPKTLTFDEDIRTAIRQAIEHYNLQSEHEDIVEGLECYSDQPGSAEWLYAAQKEVGYEKADEYLQYELSIGKTKILIDIF